MTWAQPYWALLLLAVAGLATIAYVAGRRHHAKLAGLLRGAPVDRVLPPSVRRRRAVRDALVVLGLACGVVALCEPILGEQIYALPQKGVDLVLVVDLSRSMDCTDVDPSRLGRARREIADLTDMLEGDRVGLVIFAGGAFPRMPLTQDYDALRLVTDEMSTDTFQVQGSALGDALRTGLKLLTPDASQGTVGDVGKAMLVLSDGEIHDPGDALAAADEAAAAGVHVYALGIGQAASPIPNPPDEGGFLQDHGKTVMSTPSAEVLTEVARRTGGAYVQSVPSTDDLEKLYRGEIRGSLKAGEHKTVQRKIQQSGFQWPVGLGVVAWLVAAWLGDGRKPGGGLLGLVLVAGLLAASPAMAASRVDADALYRAGRYAEAVKAYTDLTMDEPANPDLQERLGAAKFRAGDAAGAARAWDQASRLRGGDATDDYNAGNAWYQANKLEDADDRYNRALKADPGNEAAKHNQEILEQELKARREQEQQKQQQDNQQGQPGKQGQSSQQQQGGQQDQQSDKSDSSGNQPQDGKNGEQRQDGQAGDKKGGQAGDPKQDAQNGDKKDGQPKDGQPKDAQGQPKDGQPGSETAQDGQKQQGKGPTSNGKDGQQTDDQALDPGEKTDGKPVDPNDVARQGDGTKTGDQPGAGNDGGSEGGGPGKMSAKQAERLLDGVEEGRPRIYLPGDPRVAKPW